MPFLRGGLIVLEDVLQAWGGVEVDALTVYSDIFNLGCNEIQCSGESSGQFKANPLGYWRNADAERGHYRIMFDDTFSDTLAELQEADFSIINGITYFGRRNVQEHASKMYALIFDVDGVTDKTLKAFLSGAFNADLYPIPNYVALSGHNIHAYYVFEYGVPLYPNIKTQLKALKYALTDKLWNPLTSTEKKKQFQGINQGFRVIGGRTKVDGVRVRAFRLNQHPFNLEQLGSYVPEEYRVDESKLWKENTLTLAEAKKRYKKWWEKICRLKEIDSSLNAADLDVEQKIGLIKEKQIIEESKYWTCKADLYEWWKRKIKEGATYGHRYFSIMCLAIYGVKSGIDEEKVREDAYDLVPFLNAINPDEPFTRADCDSAMECYDKRYCTFPIDDIVKISGIPIKKNKRNKTGKNRKQNMARVNDIRRFKREVLDESDYGKNSKKKIVVEYLKRHPDVKNVSKIAKACDVSRTTVYKYMERGAKDEND